MMKKLLLVTVSLWVWFASSTFGQSTQGFFLDDFAPRKAEIPAYRQMDEVQAVPTATISIRPADTLARVSKYVYGNNANIYMSQMVDQPELLDHIRKLNPHVLRYPGGNLSNHFFWNAAPGHPPEDVPDTLLFGDDRPVHPARYRYGKNKSPKAMTVDHYYKMLEMTDNTGVISINYSYARYGTGPHPAQTAAHLAAEWVRYDNGRTKYWEIGNENYGPWQAGYVIDTTLNQDGQPKYISGALYGRHFRVFADSMRKAAREIGTQIYIGANLVEEPKEGTGEQPGSVTLNWNEGFMKEAGDEADFYIVHSYYTPYNEDSEPDVILNSATRETHMMMNYMQRMPAKYGVDPKPVALTEWNIFAFGSKQSCSYINGMHATMVLGSLIKNGYGMANRWNLANGYGGGDDHGMFKKEGAHHAPAGSPRWNPRPVFFYMYYFQKFFGDHMVRSNRSGSSNILAFSSVFDSGEIGTVIVNKGTEAQTVEVATNQSAPSRYYLYRLTGVDDHPPYSQRVYVNGVGPDYRTGGPINELERIKAWSAPVRDGKLVISAPARSVQYILIK